MAQPRTLASHGSVRTQLEGNDSDYSPANDGPRTGKGEKKPRKRNSIACARCRKRKIKCTGDMHDGQGCEACQAAGTSSSTCFYLRVNSHQLDDTILRSSSEPDWTYAAPCPPNHPSSTGRITSDPSQYAFANASIIPTTTSPYSGQAQFGRAQPLTDISSAPYAAAPPRPSFPSYQPNFDPNLSHPYGTQPPQHACPLQTSQPPASPYANHDLDHHWTPLRSNPGAISNNSILDHDVSSRYVPSAFAYMASTGASAPAVTADGPSMFPGMSPLAIHLPTHGTNRILPNPGIMHPSFDINGDPIREHEGAGPSTAPRRPSTFKYSEPWGLARITSGTSQGSVSSASTDAISASGPASTISSSSPTDSHEATTFGYIPLGHSSPDASGQRASAFNAGNLQTTMSPMESYASATSHSQFPALNAPFDFYGMEGTVRQTNGSTDDLAHSQVTAVPGHRPRVLRPQPRYPSAYEPLPRGPFEASAQNPRKKFRGHGDGL
ncbi:hypothetical protein MMC28_004193 [Mycoblastus sanguinarius]|nr:hypothetical protein [Mycoblastus sanguinarius]